MRGAIVCVLFALASAGAVASEPARLDVSIPGVVPGSRLPEHFAFCRPDGAGRVAPAPDRSPPVHWSAGPAATRSYAVVMSDPDVPADAALVNRADTVIAPSAARVSFYHWLLVDLPPSMRSLEEAADSEQRVVHGKPLMRRGEGRRGINDYTGFFAGSADMRGTYAGYDGPCPPWNDLRLHHYRLTVYALDVPSLPLADGFDGRALVKALQGHVLASGTTDNTFSTHATLAPSGEVAH
ncbi:YbhB/YbcL family Raf kinase inhibitor-like protein [Dyella sp.]|jgi:Raf kinase inhibitor-like YbhB/YbcL family protein|uniref:YbhB/YbcL family Raf kinase inhibitor-like protein n=1 Tax=Dyella sp. TaxID=1869338 RepID=UPI002D77C2AC|nr:YbhB/YbcL family Raf kinase inhibitor-like protein [Dyella sp.]HET6433789.1 YbhB/YbcL family Raf kinase inhibitor-like protein [Dyella sp.]